MLLKGGVRLSAYAALLSLYIFVLESEEKQMKKKKTKHTTTTKNTQNNLRDFSYWRKIGFLGAFSSYNKG